jgi:cell division protein FtsQ
LRSKKKTKKKKAVYRRGEKMVLFFKRGTILLLCVVLVAAVFLVLKVFAQQLSVQKFQVSGNYHLDRDEILKSMQVEEGQSLVHLELDGVTERLKRNPWIKAVAMRKQYPHTLTVKIEEAVPAALLRIKKNLFLIDEEGERLESIQDETVPFLPVIDNINPKDRKAMSEAIKLVTVLSRRSDFLKRESIEIGLESYGLTARIDGEFIKVGYGRYSEKFDRWIELEPEVRRRGVPIKYVDLRFKDSVIVKPLKDGKGETSS